MRFRNSIKITLDSSAKAQKISIKLYKIDSILEYDKSTRHSVIGNSLPLCKL